MYINTTPTWQYSVANPEAFVTKNKKRLKQHDGQVYLNDGDEYEIELFNGTTNPILAKIKLDGNYLSGGGLVLEPGQRVFLERYLNSPQKFKFSTYTVDGKSKQVQQAISNNGRVDIEFFNEYVPSNYWYSSSGTAAINSTPRFTTTTFNSSAATYTSNATMDWMSQDLAPQERSILRKSLIETGRTEQGSTSNQKLVQSNKTFNLTSFYNVSWIILPKSQKVLTADEVNILYCGNCGAKRKKTSFKFCPHCGTRY